MNLTIPTKTIPTSGDTASTSQETPSLNGLTINEKSHKNTYDSLSNSSMSINVNSVNVSRPNPVALVDVDALRARAVNI